MVPISHPAAIPRAFSRMFHWRAVRRCNRIGHSVSISPTMCSHCGQVFDVDIARRAGVRL